MNASGRKPFSVEPACSPALWRVFQIQCSGLKFSEMRFKHRWVSGNSVTNTVA